MHCYDVLNIFLCPSPMEERTKNDQYQGRSWTWRLKLKVTETQISVFPFLWFLCVFFQILPLSFLYFILIVSSVKSSLGNNTPSFIGQARQSFFIQIIIQPIANAHYSFTTVAPNCYKIINANQTYVMDTTYTIGKKKHNKQTKNKEYSWNFITFVLWAILLAWTAADQIGETRSTISRVFRWWYFSLSWWGGCSWYQLWSW